LVVSDGLGVGQGGEVIDSLTVNHQLHLERGGECHRGTKRKKGEEGGRNECIKRRWNEERRRKTRRKSKTS